MMDFDAQTDRDLFFAASSLIPPAPGVVSFVDDDEAVQSMLYYESHVPTF